MADIIPADSLGWVPPQHQKGAAGNAAVKHIDLRIQVGAFKSFAVFRKHFDFRQLGGLNHFFLPVHGQEVYGGRDGKDQRQRQYQKVFPNMGVFLHGSLLT